MLRGGGGGGGGSGISSKMNVPRKAAVELEC